MNTCIVNYFSEGRGDFIIGAERLTQSLNDTGYRGDMIIFSPQFKEDSQYPFDNGMGGIVQTVHTNPVTQKYGHCPPHSTHPYAFKAYGIQAARERGYEQIAWMDCSVVVFHNPQHLFDLAWQIGLVTFDNQGCPERNWTSDDCLDKLGLKAEDANFFEIEAAFQFWDFRRPKTQRIFDDFMNLCNDGISLKGASGSKRPEFNAHRHDQSILSALVRKHYLYPLNYGVWTFSDDSITNPEYDPTVSKIGTANKLEDIYRSKGWIK